MFSEDRISHLSHILLDRIWKDDLVDYPDEGSALREIKNVLHKYLATAEEIGAIVRRRIFSLGRHVDEGSQEWDVLFNKYFEEELSKRR